MKTPANSKPSNEQEHLPENAESLPKRSGHAELPEKKAPLVSADDQQAGVPVEEWHYEEPPWMPSSLTEQNRGGSDASAPSRAFTRAETQADRPYDPAEDYYENSATQSFLHDSYYPHLYHQDWHETSYDETDRLQDEYHDAAYDAQSYYHGEFYRDQAEQRQDESHASAYNHVVNPYWDSFLRPSYAYAPDSPFIPSVASATGVLAAGETFAELSDRPADALTHGGAATNSSASSLAAEYPAALGIYGNEPVVPDANELPVHSVAYTEPVAVEQPLQQADSLAHHDTRLTVNRDYFPVSRVTEQEPIPVEFPISPYSGSYTEVQTASSEPISMLPGSANDALASLVPSLEASSQEDNLNRLTVNQLEESASSPTTFSATPIPSVAYEEQNVSPANLLIESHAVPVAESRTSPAVPIASPVYVSPTPIESTVFTDGLSSSDFPRQAIHQIAEYGSGEWNRLSDPPLVLAEMQIAGTEPSGTLPHSASYAAVSAIPSSGALLQANEPARLTVNRVGENERLPAVSSVSSAPLVTYEEQSVASAALPIESYAASNQSASLETIFQMDSAARLTVNRADEPRTQLNEPLTPSPHSNAYDDQNVTSLVSPIDTPATPLASTPLIEDSPYRLADASTFVREADAWNDLSVTGDAQEGGRHVVSVKEGQIQSLLQTDGKAPFVNTSVLPIVATASLHDEFANLSPTSSESISNATSRPADVPFVLSAPAEQQLQEVHQFEEQLVWDEKPCENGSVYFADLHSSHVLIQNQGAPADGERYSRALMQEHSDGPRCLVKGESASLSAAKEDALLYAQREELLVESDNGFLPKGSNAPAAPSSQSPLPAEQFLRSAPSASEKANAFLLAESPGVTFERDSLLSSINSKDSDVEPLLAGGSPTKSGRAANHILSAGTSTVAALEIAGIVAGAVAVNAVRSVSGAALQVVSSAAQEDELTSRMDESREILMDAAAKTRRATKNDEGAWDAVSKAGVYPVEEGTPFSNSETHEKPSPSGSKELAERLQDKKRSSRKSETELGLLEPDEQNAGNGNKKKDSAGEKKPVSKRERDLLAKKEKLRDAKHAAGDHDFLIHPAEKTKSALGKGASFSKNMVISSVEKVITKENEDVATLLSMKDAGKKTVNTARNAARVPRKIAQGIRYTAQLLKAIYQTISSLVKAALAAGWPAILALAGILLVVLVIVVVVVGSLAIINENQETSEVAALVAELDANLEDEIHSYGRSGGSSASVPIYYCDARGTFNSFDEDDKDQTLDVDLKDDESDLELVDASSVSVYTNPEGIIAYIDAKYGGEWQVGAASWKVTKEWNGKTYNLIDWENVPEWVQAGLNKLDRETFRGKIQELVRDYLMEEVLPEQDYGPRDLETRIVENIAEDVADELANVIYDQQLQGVNDEVIYEAVRASIQEHGDDLVPITDEHLQEMNYQLMEEFTSIVGEQEPVALAYDEIVELHGLLNYWSEDYEHIDATQTAGGGAGAGGSGISGTNNAYGYPNSSGYNPEELEKWDGYNEVSVYGISEAGTTSVTGDGTRITNDWNDANMAIACEGLQNGYFAYWTNAYKKLHEDSSQPVRITLYNPETGATVTAEVRDCGGWRGFNPNYAGMNATRQWDLLPAAWLALGGTQSPGLMNVYWKVDNEAPVTGSLGAAAAEVVIEGYPWEKETDNISGEITVNRATYIRHDIQDLMRNVPRIEKLLGRENFASDAEYYAVIDFVVMKLKDVMLPVLTSENAEGDSYTDYFMTRRELGDPFGDQASGAPVEWVVTKRFDPGYDAFDKENVSVGIKPLSGDSSVYAVKAGTVIEAGGSSVTVSAVLDGDVDERIVYENLNDIQVATGDEITEGTKLGVISDSADCLEVSWYEVFTYVGDLDRQRGWAYCPSLFMAGFAGYEEPDEPILYAGGSARSLADCETIVDFAYSRLGCPYVWGATGPTTFDCSGLTQWCYANAGIIIPRNSEVQYSAAASAGNVLPLDESLLRPGDILWKRGHVGIYIGNNQYIHAPQTGDVVKISTGISYFTQALRFS